MAPWRAAACVLGGTVTTVVLGVLTVVILPLVGFASAVIVGDWLPGWVFVVPLALSPVAGGFVTGFLHGDSRDRSAVLGGLATALGGAVIGVVFGLLFLLLMLNMSPASGQTGDLSSATVTMAGVGGTAGAVVGAVLGAIGGVGGFVVHQRRRRRRP